MEISVSENETAEDRILEIMRSVTEEAPQTLELRDGTRLVIHRPGDAPTGVWLRFVPDGDWFTTERFR